MTSIFHRCVSPLVLTCGVISLHNSYISTMLVPLFLGFELSYASKESDFFITVPFLHSKSDHSWFRTVNAPGLLSHARSLSMPHFLHQNFLCPKNESKSPSHTEMALHAMPAAQEFNVGLETELIIGSKEKFHVNWNDCATELGQRLKGAGVQNHISGHGYQWTETWTEWLVTEEYAISTEAENNRCKSACQKSI